MTHGRQHVGAQGQTAIGGVQIFQQFFGIHHFRPADGKLRFFAGGRVQLFQFVNPAAKVFLVGFGLIQILLKSPALFRRLPVQRIFFPHFGTGFRIFAVAVQNIAMGSGVKQPLVVKLSVHFHQNAAEFL